jgi:hypothetical protein
MTEPSSSIFVRNFRILNSFGSSVTADVPLTADDTTPQRPIPFHWRAVIFLQPLFDGGAAIIVACDLPLLQQLDHFPEQSHQPQRGFRAVQVVIDLVPDRILDGQHFSP